MSSALYFFGNINGEHLQALIKHHRPSDPLILHSEGGSILAARAICNILQRFPRPTVALGVCSSAAIPIFAAGEPRIVQQGTEFLYHDSEIEIADEHWRARDLMREVNSIDEYDAWEDQFLISRLGIDNFNKLKPRPRLFYHKFALNVGLAHGELRNSGANFLDSVFQSIKALTDSGCSEEDGDD